MTFIKCSQQPRQGQAETMNLEFNTAPQEGMGNLSHSLLSRRMHRKLERIGSPEFKSGTSIWDGAITSSTSSAVLSAYLYCSHFYNFGLKLLFKFL